MDDLEATKTEQCSLEQAQTGTEASNAQDMCTAVLDRLLLAHGAYFDVEHPYEYAGHLYDGYAEFHSSMSQYVLAKRAKLWEANSHEYLFFVTTTQLDAQLYDELVTRMTTSGFDKVTLCKDHMTSYISLVIIAGNVEDGLSRIIRKTKHRKNFLFGLKGWADLRICVVDLTHQKVYSNAQGKDLVPTLEANAFEVARKDSEN